MSDLPVEEQYHRLLGMSGNLGWTEMMVPAIQNKIMMLYSQLINPSKNRKENLPDDYIRGQIAELRWIMNWPSKRLAAAASVLEEQQKMTERGNGALRAP